MKTKKLTFLSLMVGYSLILYIIETYIPNPLITIFPGAKLGLSNIITLISLIILGIKNKPPSEPLNGFTYFFTVPILSHHECELCES